MYMFDLTKSKCSISFCWAKTNFLILYVCVRAEEKKNVEENRIIRFLFSNWEEIPATTVAWGIVFAFSFCRFFIRLTAIEAKRIYERQGKRERVDFRLLHNPTLVRYKQVEENAFIRTSVHSLIHSFIYYFFSSSILSRSCRLLTASIYAYSSNRILLRLV